jgi:RHS repeat-associated protein
VITDANGNVQEQYFYYPYGGIVSSTGTDPNHYKFNGKERDTESNLDEFGARYYASALGRFMTPDWAAKATDVPYANFGNPQSLNLYSFVENNPTTTGDPDGHCGENPTTGGGGTDCGMEINNFQTVKKDPTPSAEKTFTIRIDVYDWKIYIPIRHPALLVALGHHGLPRSLFRFLPRGAARTWLEREFVTRPLQGKHYYDAAHRAYNDAVEDLLDLGTPEGQQKLAEGGLRAARQAGQEILNSDNPAIKGFLDNMTTVDGVTGREALGRALAGDGEALGQFIDSAIGEGIADACESGLCE